MKRVVITGLGILSSIGNGKEQVLKSLKEGTSGIDFCPEYKKLGMRAHMAALIKDLDIKEHIPRSELRFMGETSAYAYIAMDEAIKDAGLDRNSISDTRIGMIIGSGGSSTKDVVDAADCLRNRGISRVGPYRVTRTMSSTTSGCLGTFFKINGICYSISSACSTSAHCISQGTRLISHEEQDMVFVGGAEYAHWSIACMFDAMRAFPVKFNDSPKVASRPFDRDRCGFVMGSAAGILVLEDYQRAKARGAKIYAEITGYGEYSDGYDMVAPSGKGAVSCMQKALEKVTNKIDYINAHGTSTPIGDMSEIEAIRQVFGKDIPHISSTKALTGHTLGAAGSRSEIIYCLLMMENNFIAESAHIENLDDEFKDVPIALKNINNVELKHILSNSFGFGGANASIALSKIED